VERQQLIASEQETQAMLGTLESLMQHNAPDHSASTLLQISNYWAFVGIVLTDIRSSGLLALSFSYGFVSAPDIRANQAQICRTGERAYPVPRYG
jgi:hypothetical protein